MADVTLEQAAIIVDRALAKGRALGLAPLTVVVLDRGGHMVAVKREDNSGIMRVDIAAAKAWGALGLGIPGRTMAKAAEARPVVFQSFMAISGGRLFPVPGGVLVRDSGGHVIGATGVSGDSSERDEICAVAGIEAAGLGADTDSSLV